MCWCHSDVFRQSHPHPILMWHLLLKNIKTPPESCVFKQRTLRAHNFCFTRDSNYPVVQVCQQFLATNSRLIPKNGSCWHSEVTVKLKKAFFFLNGKPLANHHLRKARTSFFVAFSCLHSLSFWSCWHGHHMSAMCCCAVLRWQHCFCKISSWKNSLFYHSCTSLDFPMIILIMVDI